ncbi:hypothetical protein HJC23_005603 [Cyclotella cryptica]|uniref:Uncharacterized protein n=1 Tax=Cyclotella cryptica TaxID=29204 RepID=A0ABD3Q0S1_9STRA
MGQMTPWNDGWMHDPNVQLGLLAFALFTLNGVMAFQLMHHFNEMKDPVQCFAKKLQTKSSHGPNHGFLAELCGGAKCIIPESMQNTSCRKDWYTKFCCKYNTNIYPKDNTCFLKWAEDQRH